MGKKIDKKDPSLLNLEDGGSPIKNETCFSMYKGLNTTCNTTKCRYWQDMGGSHQNCVINAAEEGPFTLQEVGDIFDVTRMRICQIEKTAKQILKVSFDKEHV
tara:strand:+ start:540 stop:848 length:309 start_codon:yes stop_codon:yes gene_type:complete